MKTIIGVSHFFQQNTPKFWQIVGDLSLTLATIGAAITSIPTVAAEAGLNDFVVPAFLLTVAKYCMVGGSVLKFITKMIGTKPTV